MQKNNNKQSVNKIIKIAKPQGKQISILDIKDLNTIQNLSILLQNIQIHSHDGNYRHKQLQNNKYAIEDKKDSTHKRDQKKNKIRINQLMKQFGENIQQQEVMSFNKKTAHFKQSKQIIINSPSRSPLKKFPLRLQTKYSQNQPNTKQITLSKPQNQKQNKGKTTQNFKQPTSKTMFKHNNHKIKTAQTNRNLKQSTVTFSPLRIDISLPSLCSEDLDQIKQQRQIINQIQKDINVLINKIKANHFQQSPKKTNMNVNYKKNKPKQKEKEKSQKQKQKQKDKKQQQYINYQKYQKKQHYITKIAKK